MEIEFAFDAFSECCAADAVDLEETFARRLHHIIHAAGEGADQPAPRAFREMRGGLDGAIGCLGEFNLGMSGIARVCILGGLNADDTLFAGADFHRAADIAQFKPRRGSDCEIFFHNFWHTKLLFFWIAFRWDDYHTYVFFLPIERLTSCYCFACNAISKILQYIYFVSENNWSLNFWLLYADISNHILSTQFPNPHLTVLYYTKHSQNILFIYEV